MAQTSFNQLYELISGEKKLIIKNINFFLVAKKTSIGVLPIEWRLLTDNYISRIQNVCKLQTKLGYLTIKML